jgi:hypothetical protein
MQYIILVILNAVKPEMHLNDTQELSLYIAANTSVK